MCDKIFTELNKLEELLYDKRITDCEGHNGDNRPHNVFECNTHITEKILNLSVLEKT